MTYILRFTEALAADPAHAGGKGANLALLTRGGFPVPPGFVVTPLAYRDAATAIAGRAEALGAVAPDDHAAVDRVSAAMIGALREIIMPPALVAEISAHCVELGRNARWAVRSSSTAEDLAEAAFAGQHDTFLNCVGVRDVVRRVRDCWCSLWSPRAIAYRARLGFNHAQVAMAVVVQQMVEADTAGVAFSIDPVSGNLDDVVIDANFGLGESVVSGTAAIDHLVVDRKRSWVRAKHIAPKTTRIVATIRGTAELDVTDEEARRPALSDDQAVAVARLATQVEEHFGWPQDIEWAFAGDRLTLLQARPITTVPPRWTRDESAERFPNVVTPLTWDFVDEGFHRSLNHSFELMGLPSYDGKWFALFDHYVYGNQNAVELYARRSPVPALPLPRLVRHLPAIVQRFRWIADLPADWHRALPSFLADIERFRAERIEDYDLPNLWSYLERVNAAGTRYFLPNIAISIGHGVLHRAVRALVDATMPSSETEAICAALTQCETMTSRVNAALRGLASLAEREGVAELLRLEPSRELWLEERDATSPFWSGFREFIALHGHRETDFDAYHPTWSEAPWVVLDHVRALAAARHGSPVVAPQMSQTAAQETLLRALPSELRLLATQVIALAREFTALDDLEHYHTTRLSLPLRRGVREIGRRLVALDIVEQELDPFFARAGSLRDAIADPRLMHGLRAEIVATKAEYLAARDATPAWTLGGAAAVMHNEDSALVGIPGSPGVAEGVVHIVRGAADFAAFPHGAVLVARTTNPAWTPLFYSSCAVVTESGGPLSHGAVTAREMHIPAVMAVRDVLSRLRDGDRVRVDGRSGTIEVLSTECRLAEVGGGERSAIYDET